MKNLIVVAGFILLAHGSSGAPLPLLDPYAPPPHTAPANAAPQDFGEVVDVVITSIRARVVDSSGAPVKGLAPKDLAVRVSGREVPVLGVDWFANAISPDDTPDPRPRPVNVGYSNYTRHRVSTLGQLFVFYVQAGPHPADRGDSRALRQALPAVRQLVGRLKPDDLAAVVSYDDRLHLELDFTLDHAAVADAIDRAARNPERPAAQRAPGPVTLAPAFATAPLQEAIGPEPAIERMAHALSRLPGEKVAIYLGLEPRPFAEPRDALRPPPSNLALDSMQVSRGKWGPPVLTPEMSRAIFALQEAGAALFVLDNSGGSQDTYHANLQILASSTGGTYARMRRASAKSAEQLARTIEGYYVLTLSPEDFPVQPKLQRVELSLKGSRKAAILVPPLFVATKPFH